MIQANILQSTVLSQFCSGLQMMGYYLLQLLNLHSSYKFMILFLQLLSLALFINIYICINEPNLYQITLTFALSEPPIHVIESSILENWFQLFYPKVRNYSSIRNEYHITHFLHFHVTILTMFTEVRNILRVLASIRCHPHPNSSQKGLITCPIPSDYPV